MPPVPVVLVGGNGHGRSHLRSVRRLERTGRVRLAGVCDTRPPSDEAAELAGTVEWSADLDALLRRTAPRIVIVSTPIQTHADLAERALLAGADVLLEKPPAATLADFERLSAVVRRTGRACQVGFQCLGSAAIEELRRLITAGRLGRVSGIGVFGAWVRDAAYWRRAPWAGRRLLDGRAVCDGALTNPFAHAIAAALRIDGSDKADDIASVRTELYRTTGIEADDTSSLRIVTRRGTPIVAGVTLCAETDREPYVVVHGDRGRARFYYQSNRLRITDADGVTETEHGTDDPLDDLVRHQADGSRSLVTPLARTGGFMAVLEAVRLAPPPALIPAEYRHTAGSGAQQREVVEGVENLAEAAAERLRTYSELAAPWIVAGG